MGNADQISLPGFKKRGGLIGSINSPDCLMNDITHTNGKELLTPSKYIMNRFGLMHATGYCAIIFLTSGINADFQGLFPRISLRCKSCPNLVKDAWIIYRRRHPEWHPVGYLFHRSPEDLS